jgi:hypothetical protein
MQRRYHAVLGVNDAVEDSRAACGGLRSLTALGYLAQPQPKPRMRLTILPLL